MLWQEMEYNGTFIQDHTQMPGFDIEAELQPLVDREVYLITVHVLGGAALVVSAFGILTNAFNIVTFIAMGVEDGVTTLFLGMAWSDLVFSTLTCISNTVVILYIMEQRRTLWLSIDPVAVIYFADNASFVVQTMTALTSTFLAVARCMCVVRPLHFKNMFTRTRSLIALAVCFLFPLACQSAVFANMGMTEHFSPSKNASRLGLWFSAEREKVKDVVRLILSSIVPLATQIIVVVCVAVMISKLREAARFRNRKAGDEVETEPRSTKLAGKDRQVVIQVILICIIYMITNIPKIFHSIYSLAEPRFDVGKAYVDLYHITTSVRIVFEAINASVNFFVYFTFSQSFRSACFFTKSKNRNHFSD